MAQAGFTLVELLVVTLIVGLLAGIAAPRLDEARQKAYDAAALQDGRSVIYYIELYYNQNLAYPGSIGAIEALGFTASDEITVNRFRLRGARNPAQTRVSFDVYHEGSDYLYRYQYPRDEQPTRVRRRR
ncbi:MAG: prepilin-type N-terminal cleavage/methylation domain-containing protein [Gemmatimonadetes bacterium]|nr:prepilin-type N-terminal cleavage/methylation domain-containing protein [Gemmatimonadota bacterium]